MNSLRQLFVSLHLFSRILLLCDYATIPSLALLPASLSPVSYAISVKKPGVTLPRSARAQRNAVEKSFLQSYDAYKKYAWGRDDLTPETKSYFDGRNGWGCLRVAGRRRDVHSAYHGPKDTHSTIVAEVLSFLRAIQELFAEAVDFSRQIDSSKSQTDDTVSVFETTIRHLGGLLSAYELSEGKFPALLQKAGEVGDKMAYAWVGQNNAVPFGFLDFTTNEPVIATPKPEPHIAGSSIRTRCLIDLMAGVNLGMDNLEQLGIYTFAQCLISPKQPLPSSLPHSQDWLFKVSIQLTANRSVDMSYFEYRLTLCSFVQYR
ncbi:putative glycosyl hydrolase 47 family protein [Lyophyllum shimeji]|uniref:alpha-1,2-Mannosidase n=1 Tax=Lyophyllum shimeji TaxID=47721 RepID=A0A9P3PTP5_LYOSH|nr:putative glycosyl hydrolase 47 family protein [Lyophyllum shimeji]